MKIQDECIPCLIKRIIFESELSTKDLSLKKETIKNALKYLSDYYDPNECSAVIATKIHEIVYKTLGDEDPYRLLKKKSNEIAISLLPKVEKLLKESNDSLRTIIVCSIVGNSMDFGIDGGSKSPEAMIESFEKKIEEGLGYDNYEKLKNYLLVSKKIALFTDNCGEIVFDKILCREIKNLNNNLKISLIVKGDPILSDATIKDTEELNFKEVVDEILTTECFAVGINYKNIPEKVKNVLSDSDLIICKGMANYECFSETEYKPIAYLMRTKCNPIAKSMNLPINKNIVKIYE
jgi:uncharacterized protein with ATP-grasp and redox domains